MKKSIHFFYLCSIFLLLFLSAATAYSQQALKPYQVGLNVRNIDSIAGWYSKVLGFTVDRKMNFPEYDSLQIWFLKKDDFRLELVSKKNTFSIKKFVPDYNGFDQSTLSGFAKLSFQVNNIEEWYQRCKSLQVTLRTKVFSDQALGLKSFLMEDFEGNLIQLVEVLSK